MDVNALALDKAFELAGKVQGQPWPEARIIEVATVFRAFLGCPDEGTRSMISTLFSEIDHLTDRISALENGPEPKPTRQRPKPGPSTTETTLPDQPLDPGPAPEPEPADF